MTDLSFLTYAPAEESADTAMRVLQTYLATLAQGSLRRYTKEIYRHTQGAKRGQTLYSHIIDIVTFAQRLADLCTLSEDECRCLYLALTVHDINKDPAYGKTALGKSLRYADAASPDHITELLTILQAEDFWPQWREYLLDIAVLAHGHQVSATGTALLIDQRQLDQTQLQSRLKGVLREIIQAADEADLLHSPHMTQEHLGNKVAEHVNAALYHAGKERQYRFVGHTIAELRGLLTNIMHNELVAYLRNTYGEQSCVDVLYYPDSVIYLLDNTKELQWTSQDIQAVSARVQQRIAELQASKVAQFIKAKPAGITVDKTAIESGAALETIFMTIEMIVSKKNYKVEWQGERDRLIADDLQKAREATTDETLQSLITAILTDSTIIPRDIEALKRGEFLVAYRNFLRDHRTEKLGTPQDSWIRVYRLFNLPSEYDSLYNTVDPYRRGYFVARDLPVISLDAMRDLTLRDIATLDEHEKQATIELIDADESSADTGYMDEYLRRVVQVWGEFATQETLPDFDETLRLYSLPKRQFRQCSTCGAAFESDLMMNMQVPNHMPVQVFSNRLGGGTTRDPKRNVCPVCRTQLILEKLAWNGHRDKQGAKMSSFYLHLFPHTFFTAALLREWYTSLEHVMAEDRRAFFIDTHDYLQHLVDTEHEHRIGIRHSNSLGVNIPAFAETMSNIPVIAIVAPGSNRGQQFMLALETAVALQAWFDCRVMLATTAIPMMNLSTATIGEDPVIMSIDGAPGNLTWLVPQAELTQTMLDQMVNKLSLLHQLSEQIYPKIEDREHIPHDLAVAAVDDPLALYYTADRLLEQRLEGRKGDPAWTAVYSSKIIVPVLDHLLALS